MSKRLVLIILLLLLVACRREEQPTPQPTSAASEAVEGQATDTSEPAEQPTAESTDPEPAATEETTPTTATGAGEDPIYLAIIWHQHQPVYYQDPETGIYAKPWVRVHASKDYVDMAAILEQYPNVHATFNLTPSLIRQLDDLAAGAKDLYWVYSEIPADQLTDEQKQFILDRFFDANRKIIGRFPRYQDLLVKRDSSDAPITDYTTQDYLDLQILFNLGWTDPDWLEQEPLATLVAKGENFSEADKTTLFAEHLRLIQEVVPVHQRLQDAGQIEVTMTPFAHPILPLLVSTDLARVALPEVELPDLGFVYGQDAVTHLELGVQLYEDHFGRPPRGMWPAEGSVAQEIVNMVSSAGIQWMASDEGVLANSLGMNSFTRNPSEVVIEADTLYRPYYVQGANGQPVAMVFRDVVISDKVGFTYSGLPGEVAAADFVNRIHAIREQLIEQGAEGPHLVSVILDGENAWEHYDNDGKEFLHSMYQRLSEDPLIRTVTPTEFLAIAPDQPAIDDLWAGSWINHDFSTWIGEDEENQAWQYLAEARDTLRKYENGTRQTTPEALAEAQLQMYIAEGSDWFWWYGADQNSGDDGSFDQQFRDTLIAMYTALGEEPPNALNVPIIPQQAVTADRPAAGLISPTIEGIIGEGEWEGAGLYTAEGGVMASADPIYENLAYGFDGRNLYINVNSAGPWAELGEPNGLNRVELYLNAPGGGPANSFSQGGTLLGFPANRLVEATIQNGELLSTTIRSAAGDELWTAEATPLELAAVGGNSLEMAIPLTLLGNADVGDRISMRLIFNQSLTVDDAVNQVDTAQVPATGPAVVAVPDLGTTTIVLAVADPEGDDHGPGTYTYPQDAVFSAGNFDITNFEVGFDDENIVFRFSLAGPIDNPWGSPNGLALQTLDIYIDQDGDGTGGTAMLPGRNLAFAEGYAWDFAITAEGWEGGVFIPANGGPEKVAAASEFFILADPGQQKVTIRVPKTILGDNPEAWQYAAVIMSQEGFPAAGVMRVRDVAPVAEQWRVGGAPAGSTNHTRVIDLVWAAEGEQEAWLSNFTPTDAAQPDLTAEDFATVPMFAVEQ